MLFICSVIIADQIQPVGIAGFGHGLPKLPTEDSAR
jgi:hypothetical protein